MQVMRAGELIIDVAEHFQKMSYRNRYHISGSNNAILLSVPLDKGRDQRAPMSSVCICNAERWQVQHWRTLVSVYKRSPFFYHYEPSVQALFEKQYTHLVEFNRDALQWVMQQLKLKIDIKETSAFVKDYAEGIIDLRKENTEHAITPKYYQLFEDRIGFQPNLSILDLLFSEGPATAAFLK